MDFDLNMEQKLLKDSARNFLSKEADSSFVRDMIDHEKGYDQKQWKKMAKLDWMGLIIPEVYGGAEMTFPDMMVLLYEMGYACFPGPFFTSAVSGTLTLLEAGNDEQKKAYLPGLAKGKQIATLAWTEEEGTYTPDGISTRADVNGDSFVLSGTKLFVPYAHVADIILCAARTENFEQKGKDGISLLIVDKKSPGVEVEMLDTMTGEKLCEVCFNKVSIPKENLIGELNNGWELLIGILYKVSVAKCAEMSGGAQRVLEMVVDYAKNRVQFDQPIGSFQAIQHHCADILTYVDTSTFMAYHAGWIISQGLPFKKAASMCKAWVSDSYRKLVMLGHQVMGGVGFMEEFDLQLYFKHAKASELFFGDADFHRELVAQEMDL